MNLTTQALETQTTAPKETMRKDGATRTVQHCHDLPGFLPHALLPACVCLLNSVCLEPAGTHAISI